MGLNERRIASEYQTKFESQIAPKIEKIGDLGIKVEMVWDKISAALTARDARHDGKRLRIEDMERMVGRSFVEPIIAGLNGIIVDDMGKDLLKKSVRTIRFEPDGKNYGIWDCFKLDDKVLTVNQWDSDEAKCRNAGEELTKFLEKNL